MQIIHVADIHLGSKIDARLPKHLAEIRRLEVRKSFQTMLNYANQHAIKIILLSGDIFDSDLPLKYDKEFFYQLIEQNKHITFYYLRGNHDCKTSYKIELPNLKTFTENWTYYTERVETHSTKNEVVIAGIEQTIDNAKSLYNHLQLNANTVNIVLLHGQESRSQFGKDIVNITALQNKNIDYLALGHIHTYTYKALDNRGDYAYSGCLEGRGFDELGTKGFIVLTVENGKISHEFVANCQRQIEEIYVDLTDCAKFVDAIEKVQKNVQLKQDNIYKLILTGEIDFATDTLTEILQNHFSTKIFYLEVQDKTTVKENIENIQNEQSLRGEFVRTVLQDRQKNPEWTSKIIALGLKALSGKEV